MTTGKYSKPPFVLTAISCVVCLFLSLISFADAPDEYDVKMVYLYNFTKYMSWQNPFPEDDLTAPFNICVKGRLPSEVTFNELSGKTSHNHPIKVKQLALTSPVQDCHILFLTKALGEKKMDDIVKTEGETVLVVGETQDFARDNGDIGFVVDSRNRVRLEINLDRVQKKQMKVRSQLLEVAQTVYRSPLGVAP